MLLVCRFNAMAAAALVAGTTWRRDGRTCLRAMALGLRGLREQSGIKEVGPVAGLLTRTDHGPDLVQGPGCDALIHRFRKPGEDLAKPGRLVRRRVAGGASRVSGCASVADTTTPLAEIGGSSSPRPHHARGPAVRKTILPHTDCRIRATSSTTRRCSGSGRRKNLGRSSACRGDRRWRLHGAGSGTPRAARRGTRFRHRPGLRAASAGRPAATRLDPQGERETGEDLVGHFFRLCGTQERRPVHVAASQGRMVQSRESSPRQRLGWQGTRASAALPFAWKRRPHSSHIRTS